MSVTILNTNSYPSHAAEMDAVVALAKGNGWSTPEGQTAKLDNLITQPERETAPAHIPAPDFEP